MERFVLAYSFEIYRLIPIEYTDRGDGVASLLADYFSTAIALVSVHISTAVGNFIHIF
jgi:hypothetical protein